VFASALAKDAAASDQPPYVPRTIDAALDAAFEPAALERHGSVVACAVILSLGPWA
jgi:hypothetical protein